MQDDRQKLVKDLTACEQRLGVVSHKLKKQRASMDHNNIELNKLKGKNKKLSDALSLAYENLEVQFEDLKALKRTYKVLALTGTDLKEFERVMAK